MTNFTIQFQNKRVGSTFLQNAINSHPDLVGIDECFVNVSRKPTYRKSGFRPFVRPENKFKTPASYIDNVCNNHKNKTVTMKIMYNQIEFHNGLSQYIVSQNIPMIHLMRKNLVKQIISGKTAATTKHPSLNMTPKELFDLVAEADSLNKIYANRYKKNIKLTLYYEDVIGEPLEDKTFVAPMANNALCDVLGVNKIMMFSTTKKKNKENISVYLPNIEEIRQYFKTKKGEWLWMLK